MSKNIINNYNRCYTKLSVSDTRLCSTHFILFSNYFFMLYVVFNLSFLCLLELLLLLIKLIITYCK